MSFIIAKAEKRKMTEGKDTVFFRGETQITYYRMEHFKKRKTTVNAAAAPRIAVIGLSETHAGCIFMLTELARNFM